MINNYHRVIVSGAFMFIVYCFAWLGFMLIACPDQIGSGWQRYPLGLFCLMFAFRSGYVGGGHLRCIYEGYKMKKKSKKYWRKS